MRAQHRPLGFGDEPREALFLLAFNQRTALGSWNFHPDREQRLRMEVAAIAGDAADPDEAPRLAFQSLGDEAQAPVRSNDEVKNPSLECCVERIAKVRVGVDVFDLGRNLGHLVGAAMQDRYRVLAREQGLDQKWPRRAGAADYQCFHLVPCAPCQYE